MILNEQDLDFFFQSANEYAHPWLSFPINKAIDQSPALPTPQREAVLHEQWLREALKRLGVRDFEEVWRELQESEDAVRIEKLKKSIKHELKMYDKFFSEVHGRASEASEKEVLRPLFNFYKKLRKWKPASSSNFGYGEEQGQRQGPHVLDKELLAEKERLRKELNEYKKHFERAQGRKMQAKTDLAPIGEIYMRYKKVKEEIEKMKNVRNGTR